MKSRSEDKNVSRLLGVMLATLAIGALVLAGVMIGLVPAAFAASPVTPHARNAGPAAPVTLSLTIFKEQRHAEADGTTTVTLTPATKAVPGDRLVYVLTYANSGITPASNLVIDYPLPDGVTYHAATDGTPAPLVSSDGHTFAPATDKTVTALRWQMAGDVAPGAKGTLTFKASFN